VEELRVLYQLVQRGGGACSALEPCTMAQ
jgi:hypothetical protein